jgi:hypothetical protein
MEQLAITTATTINSGEESQRKALLKVVLIHPPPPISWIFPLFPETELLFFSRWVVLVCPGLLLEGVFVQDSIEEKAPLLLIHS